VMLSWDLRQPVESSRPGQRYLHQLRRAASSTVSVEARLSSPQDVCSLARGRPGNIGCKVNYYRLKAVALEAGCKPAKDRLLCENRPLGALYLGVLCIA